MAESMNETDRPTRESRIKYGGVFQAALLGLFIAAGWFLHGVLPAGKSPMAVSGPPGPSSVVPTVVAAKVDEGPAESATEYVGHVEPIQYVDVCAQVPGTLDAVHFQEGSMVEAGTSLFTINRDPYAARVAVAEAGLVQAETGLAVAQAAHDVAKADLTATEADLDGAKANLVAAGAGLEAAEAAQQAADANLDRAAKFLKRVQDADERSVSQADLDAALNDFLQCQAGVARCKAQVAQATAGQTQARTVVRQVEGRLAQSHARLIQAETGIDQAKAAVEQAKASLRLARIDLGYTEILAPITGRIGKALATKGNLVGPQSGPLARIVQIDPVQVTFAMPDREYLDMLQTPDYEAHLRVNLRLPNGTLYTEPGQWDYADNQMDPRTANLAIRVRFSNPGDLLVAHSYVKVILEPVDAPQVPHIPVEAVVTDEAGHSVFVVDESDTVELRRVVLGEMLRNQQCIRSGLEVGERVIVGGLQKVSPGQKVVVAIADSSEGV